MPQTPTGSWTTLEMTVSSPASTRRPGLWSAILPKARTWVETPAAERGDFLIRVSDALLERKDEFARAEARGPPSR
jgi:hypothetical protein